MRIAMLSSHYLDNTHGGVESHVYYLGRELSQMGHIVLVLRASNPAGGRYVPTPPSFEHVARVVPGEGLSARLPGKFGSGMASRVMSNGNVGPIVARLQEFKPDLIHHHDLIENYRAATRGAAATGASIVWTNHLGESLLLARSGLGRRVLYGLSQQFDAAFSPSRELLAVTHVSGPSEYCPNGVDVDLFRPLHGEARHEQRSNAGIPAGSFCILVPRRWAPTKGILNLVKALRKSSDARLHVVFVGAETPGYERYGAQIRAELQEWRVDFRIVDGVAAAKMPVFYQMADLAIFPSILEATSLGVLEAMASGCLVLGTAVGGIPELITDGMTGLLCAPGEGRALEQGILRAQFMSVEDRRQLTAAARDLVTQEYSWRRIAQRVEKVYLHLRER